MFNKNSSYDSIDISWSFNNTSKYGNIYKIILSTCTNPFCLCETISIKFLNENKEGSFSYEFDVFNNQIYNRPKTLESKRFLKQIKKEISNEDWDLISDIFFHLRYVSTEQFTLENFDEAKLPLFNNVPIENGTLQSYSDYFLWDNKLSFCIDNITYYCDDMYCLKSECECSEVALEFYGVINNNDVFEKNQIPSIVYDYKKRTYEMERNVKYLPHKYDILFENLKSEFPDISNVLKDRHSILIAIYSKFKNKTKPLVDCQNKIYFGRNKPCPCGSSKKYKFCCGKE